MIVFSLVPPTNSTLGSGIIIALLWVWTGAVYQIGYFSTINPAATIFGIFFIIQGLLTMLAVFRLKLGPFSLVIDIRGIAGAIFVIYAMLIYPLLNAAQGHTIPRAPTFGLPCPLVIFTLGVFLWSTVRPPLWVCFIPVAWAIVGTSAAFLFGVWPDSALFIAALAFLVLTMLKSK